MPWDVEEVGTTCLSAPCLADTRNVSDRVVHVNSCCATVVDRVGVKPDNRFMTAISHPETVFLATLEELVAATDDNVVRADLIRKRVDALRAQIAGGTDVQEALANEPSPLIVELITENINALQDVGARLRWAAASLLRDEGMSAADIARLFGVSRQRVSALLNNPPVAAERTLI